MDLIIIIFIFVVFITILTFAYGGISAAPWVPLWKSDIRRMLKVADLQAGEQLVDLGSGDGRILRIAAGEFKARSLGFEIAFLPYLYSLAIITISNLKNKHKIKVKYKSFFPADLSTADVITVFLSSRAMEKLEQKFSSGLKDGCRIVSYAFKMPNWQPEKIDKPNKNKVSVYLYRVKQKK